MRAMFGAAMVTIGPAEPLLGRRSEREALGRLRDAARGGQSGVLVVAGEPGVGKTALLEYAIESASGFRVARAVGVEGEMELPFAALQQFCAPMMNRLGRLPAPQRGALGVAFGVVPGDAPDRFLVGLAVLNLLSEVAVEQPLLCVVEDAQWLDRASAQALAFVARRLLAESVALIFATREPSDELRGLPQLIVGGLRDSDARALLRSVLPGPLDELVRDRLVPETRGNPLALLELPRGSTPAELAGGFGLPVASALSSQIEESFQRRLAPLPAQTRRLLLLAAAEPTGEPALVWRAAERLGIDPSAADAAEAEGLLEVGANVTFRHPLVRSAVYRAASRQERREAHRVLSEATYPDVDPDRRAWHRAQATSAPDEDVASELERSAARAQARGGLAAAAAFLERAAALTPEPAARARRALAAGKAKHQAGALDAALRLVAIAEAGPLDEFQRAQADVLRAQVSFASSRGSDAPPLLLKAARRLEPLDLRLARETYLDALSAAVFAGRLAGGSGTMEVAEAACAVHAPLQPPRAPDLLLDGLGMLISEGHLAGAPILRRALCAFRGDEISSEEGLRWLWVACHAAGLMWDYESWDVLSARQVQVAVDAGALTVLPIALNTRAGVHLFAGELGVAASLIAEVDAANEVTGSSIAPYGAVGLTVFRGRESEASQLIDGGWPPRSARPMPRWRTTARVRPLRPAVPRPARPHSGPGRCRGPLSPNGRTSDPVPRPGARPPSCRRAARTRPRPAPSSGSRRAPAPVGPPGRAGSRPARERCSATATTPRASIARRSRRLGPPRFASRPRARTCSGANGCAAGAGASTRASTCAARTNCHGVRHGGLRRARARGAQRHRRARTQADGRDARRPDRAGVADQPPCGGRRHERRDRRAAVHQHEHRRLPPAQGVSQARREVPHPARAPCSRVRRVTGSTARRRSWRRQDYEIDYEFSRFDGSSPPP
jgi:hypothetical protein